MAAGRSARAGAGTWIQAAKIEATQYQAARERRAYAEFQCIEEEADLQNWRVKPSGTHLPITFESRQENRRLIDLFRITGERQPSK
jgi:hypothetical protein